MCAVSLSQRGLSLIEVVVATAVLALTVACVTAVVTAAQHLQGRAGAAADLEQLVDSETVRLHALPFCPPAEGGSPGSSSLLGEVFPHADPTRTSSGSAYEPDVNGASGGAFVTTVSIGRCQLRREARFVRADGEQWVPVAAVDLLGWDVTAVRPPASALEVRLAASRMVGGRQATAVRTLLALAVTTAVDPGGR